MVDILLATYNGEKYIEQQIKSLLEQTYNNINIIIRDDGSDDRTIEIIEKYAEMYPDIIKIIKDKVKCKSAKRNFYELLKYASSNYIMFCDQDDYWMPDKIQVTLDEMNNSEEKYGKKKPIVIFTDYEMVDDNLMPLAINEKKTQVYKCKLDINHLLVQNYVTGCTMMINKRLKDAVLECYTDKMVMHDWWFALYASCFGVISHIPRKTIKYRQHSNNCVGAVNVKSFKYRINKFFNKGTKKSSSISRVQALEFIRFFRNELDANKIKEVDYFVDIANHCKFSRMYRILKGKYLKSDIVRIIGQLWYI